MTNTNVAPECSTNKMSVFVGSQEHVYDRLENQVFFKKLGFFRCERLDLASDLICKG